MSSGGHWSAAYVGLPWRDHGRDWAGIDCYGLVRLVLAEVAGIDLPSHAESYVSAAEARAIAGALGAAVDQSRDDGDWIVVTGALRALDVVVMRSGRFAAHVGILASPAMMLHVSADRTAALERVMSEAIAPRIVGVYRHRRLA